MPTDKLAGSEVALLEVLGSAAAKTWVSSSKAQLGHTLGAAGIVESVFALLALAEGLLPGTLNSSEPDPACGPQVKFDNAEADVRFAMNNSFGFGGNNASLVFGRA